MARRSTPGTVASMVTAAATVILTANASDVGVAPMSVLVTMTRLLPDRGATRYVK